MMTTKADDITKQALALQKGTFACWFDAMSIIRDQASLTVDNMSNQNGWIPDEVCHVIPKWVDTCKKEYDWSIVYMEESFSAFEKYFGLNTKSAPARANKPAPEAKTA